MAANQNRRIKGSCTSASDPAVGAVEIDVGGGDQPLDEWSRGIYISADGDLAVVMNDGTPIVFTGLKAGIVYPFCVQQITQTGTTAEGVVLL